MAQLLNKIEIKARTNFLEKFNNKFYQYTA